MSRSRRDELTRFGFYGLAPFVASAVVLWLSPYLAPPHVALDLQRFTLVYGAVFVGFFAGLGAAPILTLRQGQSRSWLPSVLATLAGVVAVIPDGAFSFSLGAAWRHLIILLALLYLLMRDMSAVAAGLAPKWYGALRSRLTFWAVLSLALIISRLMLWRMY